MTTNQQRSRAADIVNIADAKARLPELVDRASRGEEIVIARNGQPKARLVPLEPEQPRIPGHGAGQWEIGDDFNEPLPAALLTAFGEEPD